ncbi:MAG: ABC transporter substrate-binding protein, partial [Pseudomonadota bacterium]
AGFKSPIYTYYAASDGITKTFGEAGKGVLRLVGEGQVNPPVSTRADDYTKAFKAAHPELDVAQPRIANVMEMLARAINEAGTATDMVKIADALSGMEHDSIWGSKLKMRPQDHQLIQDVHIFAHTNDDMTHDFDNSGFGLLKESTVTMASMDAPTTCKMKRP